MSQVNADTIRKSDGSLGTDIRIKNTSVYESDGGTSVTQNVVQGLAKARGQHAAGTLQSGSLNHTSITDHAAGNFTHTFTNNFSSKLYSHVGSCTHNAGSSSAIWTYMRIDGAAGDTTTSSIKVASSYVDSTANRTDYDFSFVDLICLGDLA